MYKIIGADQKEYGPITADQIRKWISEGRADAQTSVCAESSSEWKPLGAFPEFTDLLSPLSTSSSTAPLNASLPTQPPGAIKVFGILNIVFGSLRLLCMPLSLVTFTVAMRKASHHDSVMNVWMIFSLILGTIIGALMITSGIGLCQMRAWARQLAVYLSLAVFVLTLVNSVVTFSRLSAMHLNFSDHVPYMAFAMPLFAALLGLSYNGLLIFFLTRLEVKRALGETTS